MSIFLPRKIMQIFNPQQLRYHYCIPSDRIVFGEIKADKKYSDKDFQGAYEWLEREIGFYPLFLAVGHREEDIRMTGYQNNWRSVTSNRFKDGRRCTTRRKSGEFPNDVLFSFEGIDGIFMDYDAWHLVLNAHYKNFQMSDYERKLIFKYSWSRQDWLRKAKYKPHSVQLVTQRLYPPSARRVWVRNRKTKTMLENKGFQHVTVKRLLLEELL